MAGTCDGGDIRSAATADKYVCHPMWRQARMAHTQFMFPSYQLTATLSNDRQTRMRSAAAKRRLIRRYKAPPAERSLVSVLSVVWPDDARCPASEHRAQYAT
jgi:hypothetical protein